MLSPTPCPTAPRITTLFSTLFFFSPALLNCSTTWGHWFMSLEEQKSKINTQAASSGLRTVGNTAGGREWGRGLRVCSMYGRTAEGRQKRIVGCVCVCVCVCVEGEKFMRRRKCRLEGMVVVVVVVVAVAVVVCATRPISSLPTPLHPPSQIQHQLADAKRLATSVTFLQQDRKKAGKSTFYGRVKKHCVPCTNYESNSK